MDSFLSFRNIWEDRDIKELEISICDGKSTFTITVYAEYNVYSKLEKQFEVFSRQIYGGETKIQFGAFGPKYASGAFEAVFHFAPDSRGRIYITIKLESEYFDFGNINVASEAKMFLITEPVLFDKFYKGISSIGLNQKIVLQCIV